MRLARLTETFYKRQSLSGGTDRDILRSSLQRPIATSHN